MHVTPLYAIGATITTPLGAGVVRSRRLSRFNPGTILYEVQLDSESCVRTWTEAELASAPRLARAPVPRTVRHFVPGEAVSTPDGEGIIRNLLRDGLGFPMALVQLVGTEQTREVPCADLAPPLEAA